jgi:TonB family protein
VTALNNPAFAEWTFNLAIHSLVILVLCRILLRVAHRGSAPLKSGISLVAMAAVMILPFYTASILSLPNKLYRSVSVSWEVSTIEQVSSVGFADPLAPADQGFLPAEPPAMAVGFRQFQSPFAALSGKTAPPFIVLTNGFGLIWLAVFVLLLGRLLAGALSARHLQKTGTPLENKHITSLLNRTEKSFGKKLGVSILECSRVGGPMAIGVFRPKILVPPDFLQHLTDRQITGVLFHEMSHIYHRDQINGILQRIFTALIWWNPLAHRISSEFSKAREEVSDTHVLLNNDSKEYARCLIDLAERTIYRHLPVSALASPSIPLTERVKNILSKERNMDTKLKPQTVAAILSAAFLCLVLITGNRLSFAVTKVSGSLEATVPGHPHVYDLTVLPQEQTGKETREPKLVKSVEPVYPEEAVEKSLEDTVVIEGRTDTEGNVIGVEILKGKHEILNKAAAEAVKQWKYEPMIIDGKARAIFFTVSCRFRLDPEKKKNVTVKSAEAADEKAAPVYAIGDIKGPKLITKVEPVYPEEAKKNGIKGIVIIEATTNDKGDVVDTNILKSVPGLDQAAIDALKQWKYEPMIISGKPKGFVFTVTMRFNLK